MLTELLLGIRKAQIASIKLDASLSEEHSSNAQVTQYPVETGAFIGDHVIYEPVKLSITGVISNTPIQWFSIDAGRRSEKAWDTLLQIQFEGEPITIITTLKTYYNMIITSLSCPRDAERGHVIEFTMTAEEVTTVETETADTNIKRPKVKKAGKTSTKSANVGQNKTAKLRIAEWGDAKYTKAFPNGVF